MKLNENQSDEKFAASEISVTEKSPFFKWLDNFWYHHKWTLIAVTFFAVVIIICVVQTVGKTEPDSTLTFAGPVQLTSEQTAEINRDLTSLVDDTNKDGHKLINLLIFSVYSEEELKEANESETDENGHYVPKVNSAYNSSAYQEYSEYTGAGDCSIYFVSEFLYENLKKGDRLRPLSELFEEGLPTGALSDGYGVRLGDTDLYKHFESLKALPEDTVICLMRPYVWGESSNKKSYEAYTEYFKSIVSFTIQ